MRRALSSKTAAKAVRAREAARAKSPKATGGKSPKVPGTQSARVGVIDLGSNSVRLVVYDGMGRAPQPIFNERALCGLGRKLGETGRLNRQGAKMALENMARFVLAAEAMRVDRLDVVATEAVRAADDGPAFVADLERRFGIMVEVLKGEMEGKLSAYGVVSGIPEARGMMGDLGGGSLEVVTIARGGQPGHCASLPIGPLRLLSTWDKNPKKARKTIDDAFGRLGWLASVRGETFYPVGGAWRALANIHMQQINYPLHVIHEYEMPVSEAKELLGIIMHLSPSSLARIERVPKKRLDTLPLAAVALDRLIDIMQPDRLVFSAQGLREGLLYSKLTPAQRQDDPLLAACMIIANRAQRFDVSGQELYDWIDPLFSKESAADKRLRMAACLLGDIAWNEHPDYRAEQAFWRVLRMPLTGLDHPGRVFLATAIGARYGANVNGDGTSDTARIYQMISPDELDRAQVLGKALRFAFTLSAGSRRILKTTRLSLDKTDLTLKLPSGGGALLGEMVTRRFESIAKQLGRKPRLSGAGKKLLDG